MTNKQIEEITEMILWMVEDDFNIEQTENGDYLLHPIPYETGRTTGILNSENIKNSTGWAMEELNITNVDEFCKILKSLKTEQNSKIFNIIWESFI